MPKQIARWLKFVLIVVLSATDIPNAKASTIAPNAKIQNGFQTRNLDGKQITLTTDSTQQPLTLIAFLGAQCPMAKIYGPKLNQLQQEFSTEQLRVIGINSNSQDSFADVTQYVKAHRIEFEFIRDAKNVIADQFAATRTPEVFLLDAKLNVLYHGRIDDQYFPGITKSAAARQDLKIAITEALAGKSVSVAETKPTGCLIGRIPNSSAAHTVENRITYSQHIVPLLKQHCIECHRAEEIGPFEMTDYVEVAGWADTMLETIDNGRMPPWHAESGIGDFHNARSMLESDRQLFRDWIAGGLKPGDAVVANSASQPTATPTIAATSADNPLEGWPLADAPDIVVEMRNRPYVVPADGVVEYQYFVADPKLTEDRWIKAARVIPGARSVVHHAIVFIRPPDNGKFQGVGLLAAYVPGQQFVPLPAGAAQKIVAGSQLVFQMHYTPNGQEQPDTSKIAISFASESKVTDEVYTLIALEQEFEIPPRTANHMVSTTLPWFPKNGQLLSVAPHMHFRGNTFLLEDESGQPLLSVPNYDFNWQHTYAYRKALPFSEIGKLKINVGFDNSSNNPFNPNPNEWVTWGDQTWEEMAVAFFQVSEPRKPTTNSKSKSADAKQTLTIAEQAKRQQKIDRYVERALSKMDANQDGQIARSETSVVVRHFNFRDFDHDGNGIATRDELIQIAKSLYDK